MKIIVVSPFFPSLSSGACTRVYHLIKALASEYAVSLLLLGNGVHEKSDLLEDLGLKQIVQVPWDGDVQRKRIHQALTVLRGRSFVLDSYQGGALQNALDDLFAKDHYDAVLFESVFTAGYRTPQGARVIIDEHNLEYELQYRTYQQEKSLVRKWYSWWESRQIKPVELERCRNAQLVFVTSDREAEILRSLLPETTITVVPNGVDVVAFGQVGHEQEVPDRIVFTGAMDYYPNLDAVLYFAQECWPLIRASVPTATWQIVGKNPPAAVMELADAPAISVTGTVPDVKPYLAAATIAIAPLRIGSGTRLKILEACAMGKAVVSTSIGCEGLGAVSGKHLIVEDQPDRLAESIVRLLRDTQRRISLGVGARALAETFTWSRSAGRAICGIKQATAPQRPFN
jgi:glycosyltransferase involved in cell wall biosynthesis